MKGEWMEHDHEKWLSVRQALAARFIVAIQGNPVAVRMDLDSQIEMAFIYADGILRPSPATEE